MLRGIKRTLIKKNLNKILEILRKEDKYSSCRYVSSETLGKEYKNKFDDIYPK